VAGTNTATRKEYNWAADFMVGRDIGIGTDAQIDFGVRVAEIHSATNGLAQWNAPTSSTVVHESYAYQQSSTFFGAGPRIAVQGSIPFAPAWSIDYEAGAAALASVTSVDPDGTSITCFLVFCLHRRLSGGGEFHENNDGVQHRWNVGLELCDHAEYQALDRLPRRRLF
jgi:hypothetical protein